MGVERFPLSPSTPLLHLHKLLEQVDDIESMVCVIAWKDGDGVTHQVTWTSQPYSRMAMAAMACQHMICKEIMK